MSDDQDSETRFDKHPALRNFDRMGFMTQHVVKNTLKWGAIGAVAAIAAAAAVSVSTAAAVGWWLLPIALIGAGINAVAPTGWLGGQASGFAWSTVATVAPVGGLIGAAVGGIVALSGVSEAADAEEDRLVAKFEQAEARRDRMAALERRRDEQRFAMENQEIALRSPNLQIPRGRAAQQRLGNTPA